METTINRPIMGRKGVRERPDLFVISWLIQYIMIDAYVYVDDRFVMS